MNAKNHQPLSRKISSAVPYKARLSHSRYSTKREISLADSPYKSFKKTILLNNTTCPDTRDSKTSNSPVRVPQKTD